jgi:peptidoglycan/xylan/chitin deacetylase (PgdA/CDA1 family)
MVPGPQRQTRRVELRMKSYPWPDGARAVIFLSVNFDAETLDLKETTPDRMYGRFGYGRYGVRAGFPRLVALLEKHSIPATFFVAASDARRHPDLIRTLVAKGHEIGARGIDLEDFSKLGDAEPKILKESRDILADVCGKAPVGFRAPDGNMSVNTLRHLAELGYEYDASFLDSDFPYCMEPVPGKTIIEVPATYALDDGPIYSARHTHARVMTVFRDEIYAMREAGTLIPLTLHLRGDFGSTRGARIAALDELFTQVKSHGDTHFMNGAAIAAHARSLGLTPEPDPAAAHLATLAKTVYRGDLAVKPK